MATHFFGVTVAQMPSAIRHWGKPDHIHAKATWSVLGDLPATDTVVFGEKAFPLPKKWRGKRLAAHQIV